MKHNVELPADFRPWIQVVFGERIELTLDAQGAVRDAGSSFFVTAAAALERAGIELRSLTKEVTQATRRKGPALYMPWRAALTGATHGPELGPLLKLLGVEKARARLSAAAQI